MFKIDYKTRDLERENQRQDLYWFNHQKDLHPVDLINTRPSTIELLSYKHYIHLLPIAKTFPLNPTRKIPKELKPYQLNP